MSPEERERENRHCEEVMIVLQKVKEKVQRHMGLAPAHMSKQGISYVRSRGRLMKHTRSYKIAGNEMEIRFHLLSSQS
ncbi:unnamed protein product [Camellia sinensis]